MFELSGCVVQLLQAAKLQRRLLFYQRTVCRVTGGHLLRQKGKQQQSVHPPTVYEITYLPRLHVTTERQTEKVRL